MRPALLLFEVECDKSIKTDAGSPTVKPPVQPVLIPRQIGAITTRRSQLDDAKNKLKDYQTKLAAATSTSKKNKAEVDVACQQLRIKAAENRLKFAIERWKLLLPFMNEKEKKGKLPAETKAQMAFGDKLADGAQVHLDKHDEEGADIPPYPDVKYDRKKGHFVAAATGEKWELPDDLEPKAIEPEAPIKGVLGPGVPAGVPTPAPAPAPEPEPEPEPPKKTYGALSLSGKLTLGGKIKAHVISNLKTGAADLKGAFEGIDAVLEVGGVAIEKDDELLSFQQSVLASVLKSLKELTPDQHAKIAEKAKELVAAEPGSSVPDLVNKLATSDTVSDLTGGVLSFSSATSFINDAKAAPAPGAGEMKDFDSYTSATQQKIKGLAKSLAIHAAYLAEKKELDSVLPTLAEALKVKLAEKKVNLTAGTLMSLGQEALSLYTNKGWDGLYPAQQQAAEAVAKKAVEEGKSVAEAMATAGIAHLNADGLKKLQEKVEAKPDPDGFVKEIEQALKKLPKDKLVPVVWGHISGNAMEILGKPIVALMSSHHIPEADEALKQKVEKAAGSVLVEKYGSGSEFEVYVNQKFDDKAASTTPVKMAYVGEVEFEVYGKSLAKYGAQPQTFKLVYNMDSFDYIAKLYDKWFEKWQAKQPKEPEPGTSDGELNAALSEIDTKESGTPQPKAALAGPLLPEIKQPPKTKFKKISKSQHLTVEQKHVLKALISQGLVSGLMHTKQGKLKKQLGGAALKIQEDFKALYAAAGVTGIGKPLVSKYIDDALTGKQKLPTGATPGSYYQSAKALHAQYKALTPEALNTLTFKQKAQLKNIAGIYEGGMWAGAAFEFGSAKNQQLFASLVAIAQKAMPDTPPPAPDTYVPAPAVATAPSTTAPKNLAQMFGMGAADLAAYADLGALPNSKKAPAFGPGWGGSSVLEGALSDTGGHAKMFHPTGPKGEPHTGGKAPGAFMYKHDGYRALGEAAANRVQALLGLGGPGADAYVVEKGGKAGVMQWFATDKKNLRKKYGKGSKPWLNAPANERAKIVAGLQAALVSNWLIGDKDDHGGNFVFGEDGRVQGIDHGQANKYFDSSYDMVKDWNWKSKSEWGQSGWLEDDKGWPKRMLMDYAAGADIPLPPLTDPAFSDMIERAENIPDDVYDKMWRPYAEKAAAGGRNRLARFSTVASDKTVDGFMSAMQEKRKRVRSDVAALFSMLAKTRAESLKAKGDPRSVDEIEASIREHLGLDKFAAEPKEPIKAAENVEPIVSDDEAWSEEGKPETSHVPSAAALAKAGSKGLDMQLGGADVKDGRASFYQLGDVPLVTFNLDTSARAQLQSRLPGAPGMPQPPPKPVDFVPKEFVPPTKPTFDQSDQTLFDKAMGSAFTNVSKPDGGFVTKVEKYVRRWSQGKELSMPNAANYMAKALAASREMKMSADPVEAAAGNHYEAQLLKIGSDTGPNGFEFYPLADVPEDERSIKSFELTDEIKAKQDEAKANLEAEYAKSVEKAKKQHETDEAKRQDEHQKKIDTWQKKMDDYNKLLAESEQNVMSNAVKLPYCQMPTNVKHASNGFKAKLDGAPVKAGEGEVADSSSEWDGSWKPSWDSAKEHGGNGQNPHDSYEIDLTDVITQLGMKATGKKTGQFKIHYVPGKTSGHRKIVGRAGQVTVQFPEGSTKEQIHAMLRRASEVIGIDLRPATAQDQELTYLRRMAWLRKLEGYKTDYYGAEPAGTVQEKINFWVDKFKARDGYDPRHAPELNDYGEPKKVAGKVQMKTGPGGAPIPNPYYQPEARDIGHRHSFRRFDFTDEALEKYKSKLKMGHRDASGSLAKLNEGMLASTEWRTSIGVMDYGEHYKYGSNNVIGGGKSSAEDVQSGGSRDAYIYTRQSGLRLAIHPAMLLETAAYSVGSDNWGTKVDYSHGSSPTLRQTTLREDRPVTLTTLTEIAEHGHSNAETTIGDRVDLFRWMTTYKVPGGETAKQTMVDAFDKKGITHVGAEKGQVGAPRKKLTTVLKG